jgi:hypothetical protein
MAHLVLVAAYSRGKWSCSNRERASDTGFTVSLISLMVEVREDQSRPQPGVRQVLQRQQNRLQPILARRRGQAVVPGVGLLL